jgi:hypothetical protein
MDERKKLIKLEISETAAAMLALFCKRTIVERVEAFAAHEAEAYKMMKALEDLQRVLEKQGYSPR